VVLAVLLSRAAGAVGAASFSHGTFFIFELSADYAVVAIDSRETISPRHSASNKMNRVNDASCKIRPLAPNAFFFATGFDSAFNGVIELFDVRSLANDAYANASRPLNFENLADKWATWTEASFRHARLSPEALKNPMVKGYFVGTEDNGELAADAVTIGYHADG